MDSSSTTVSDCQSSPCCAAEWGSCEADQVRTFIGGLRVFRNLAFLGVAVRALRYRGNQAVTH